VVSSCQVAPQALDQVPDGGRSVNPRIALQDHVMSLHKQRPFSKYTYGLMEHQSGSVVGDTYQPAPVSVVLVPLLARTILTHVQYGIFFPPLPQAVTTTLNGQIPMLDTNRIIQACGSIIASGCCAIKTTEIGRLEKHNSVYFLPSFQDKILKVMSEAHPYAFSNLQTWWFAKFQLERFRFTLTHYPQNSASNQQFALPFCYPPAPAQQHISSQDLSRVDLTCAEPVKKCRTVASERAKRLLAKTEALKLKAAAAAAAKAPPTCVDQTQPLRKELSKANKILELPHEESSVD